MRCRGNPSTGRGTAQPLSSGAVPRTANGPTRRDCCTRPVVAWGSWLERSGVHQLGVISVLSPRQSGQLPVVHRGRLWSLRSCGDYGFEVALNPNGPARR